MYSYGKRMRAVEIYVKSGFSPRVVYNALGYPSKNSVKKWHREYLEEQRGFPRIKRQEAHLVDDQQARTHEALQPS